MIPDAPDPKQIRARQRSRSIVMALGLLAFVILLFAISIAKMTVNR